MVPTIYESMTDQALAAEIADLVAAKKLAMHGGDVGEVRGEGRLMKYTAANMGELNRELDAALREKARRDPNFQPGSALQVEF